MTVNVPMLVTFLIYIAGIMFIGLMGYRATNNFNDYILGGRRLGSTVTALSALANGGFFDQTLCHRLTTEDIQALQCGDPTATGLGGPNFTYRDENLPTPVENNYPAGVVAMHNSGQDTNGSQFFIFYADTSLPPSYTIWGKVTKGLEIIQMVAKSGVLDGKKDGAPKLKIGIEKVKVRQLVFTILKTSATDPAGRLLA